MSGFGETLGEFMKEAGSVMKGLIIAVAILAVLTVISVIMVIYFFATRS